MSNPSRRTTSAPRKISDWQEMWTISKKRISGFPSHTGNNCRKVVCSTRIRIPRMRKIATNMTDCF
jgi:hypothetical protein